MFLVLPYIYKIDFPVQLMVRYYRASAQYVIDLEARFVR